MAETATSKATANTRTTVSLRPIDSTERVRKSRTWQGNGTIRRRDWSARRNQKRRRAAREPAEWRAFDDGKTNLSSPIEHAGASVKPFLQPALYAYHRRCYQQDPGVVTRLRLPTPLRRNRQ